MSLTEDVSSMILKYDSGTPITTSLSRVDISQRINEYRSLPAIKSEFEGLQQKMLSCGELHRETIGQIFYLIRFILESVITETKLSNMELDLPGFDPNASILVLFERLEECAEVLAYHLQEMKEKTNSKLVKEVMKYINNHYTSASLYADQIGEHFNISRNNVFRIVRDQTGKSLNEYIEKLRMEKAIDLLKNTDMKISVISSTCGYNSRNTFYKVFRKYYSVMPSSYRKRVQI